MTLSSLRSVSCAFPISAQAVLILRVISGCNICLATPHDLARRLGLVGKAVRLDDGGRESQTDYSIPRIDDKLSLINVRRAGSNCPDLRTSRGSVELARARFGDCFHGGPWPRW